MTETSGTVGTDCVHPIRHSPAQIIRYSNRIEILNPGYSLKDMASLGTPGSRLRNPVIAAVLHELNWAETKGSGSRTYYTLTSPQDALGMHLEQGERPLEGGNRVVEGGKPPPQGGKRTLPDLPPDWLQK